MSRWQPGEAQIRALLKSGDLQLLVGENELGEQLLHRARTMLNTARLASATDPDSAFVLAYDAARSAVSALLAAQGLRATSKGGHYAVERAAQAQFGSRFRRFGSLRRRRNELEYPQASGDEATAHEALDAVEDARAMVRAAQELMGDLEHF